MGTILLVEDELEMARVVRRELQANGYRVVHAADGVAALDLNDREDPDLVILDWMLPTLDGLEVLRRIRQRSTVPILMLTARGEEVDRVIELEVGADDYLPKPFGMRALLRRIAHVQEIMEQDRREARDAVRYGPLQLDPQAYTATRVGEALSLTRTEFDLLHLMMRNPGRAFSRAYLLDTVWGQNYVSGDRAVDNAILRLRKKLGDLGEAIETVWGIGYRLLPEEEAWER